jgi:hypothetical protein
MPDELAEWAELQRRVFDAQLRTMRVVKRYREDKGDAARSAEAQDLIDEIQARRALIDEVVPNPGGDNETTQQVRYGLDYMRRRYGGRDA